MAAEEPSSAKTTSQPETTSPTAKPLQQAVFANYRPAVVVLPGDEMQGVALRESLLLMAVALVAALAGTLVSLRRRPY